MLNILQTGYHFNLVKERLNTFQIDIKTTFDRNNYT